MPLARIDQPVLYFASMTPDEFSDEHIPLGYLITIRAYGTWLHGTAGSVDRFHNRYGTPKLPANAKRRQYNQRLLAAAPVTLGPKMRRAIEEGINETCEIRKWTLWALNARTNHVHSVVTANCKPKKVVAAFKANATRKMREARVWSSERSPWWAEGAVENISGLRKR